MYRMLIITLVFIVFSPAYQRPIASADTEIEIFPDITPIEARQITLPAALYWDEASSSIYVAQRNEAENGLQIAIETWSLSNMQSLSAVSSYDALEPRLDGTDLMSFSPDGTRVALLSAFDLSVFNADTQERMFFTEGASPYFMAWRPGSNQIAVQSSSRYFAFDLIDLDTGVRIEAADPFPNARQFPGAVIYNASWGSSEDVAVIAADNQRAIVNVNTGVITDIDDCCPNSSYIT